MKTITKFPDIAILFGVLAIVTSLILVFNVSKVINYIFAVFWFVIGLFGFYATRKSFSSSKHKF